MSMKITRHPRDQDSPKERGFLLIAWNAFVHRTCVATPNDLKLSDGGGQARPLHGGGKAAAEAAGVTGRSRSLQRMVRRCGDSELNARVQRITRHATLGEANEQLVKGGCVILSVPLEGNWEKRTARVSSYVIGHFSASDR